jgi:hypothetical protein
MAGLVRNTSYPSLEVDGDQLSRSFVELVERLRNNYPFFHPRYAGQIAPPHPVAMIGYVVTMLIKRTITPGRWPATLRWRRKSSPSWPRCSATEGSSAI